MSTNGRLARKSTNEETGTILNSRDALEVEDAERVMNDDFR